MSDVPRPRPSVVRVPVPTPAAPAALATRPQMPPLPAQPAERLMPQPSPQMPPLPAQRAAPTQMPPPPSQILTSSQPLEGVARSQRPSGARGGATQRSSGARGGATQRSSGARGGATQRAAGPSTVMRSQRNLESDIYDIVAMSMPYYPQVLVYIPSSSKTLLPEVYKYAMKVRDTYDDKDKTAGGHKSVMTLHTAAMGKPWEGFKDVLGIEGTDVDSVIKDLNGASVTVESTDIESMISTVDTADMYYYILLVEDRDQLTLMSNPLNIGTSNIVGVIAPNDARTSIAAAVDTSRAVAPLTIRALGQRSYKFIHTADKEALEIKWLDTVVDASLKIIGEVMKDVMNVKLMEDLSNLAYMNSGSAGIYRDIMAKTFTSPLFSVNNERNYEALEIEGDALIRFGYLYIMKSMPSLPLNPAAFTQLITKYMSKTNQAKIAARYGMHRYVRGFALRHNNDSLKEDVLEAFTSAVFNVIAILYKDLGYAFVVLISFLSSLFDITQGITSTTGSQAIMLRDPKTQVLSFLDKLDDDELDRRDIDVFPRDNDGVTEYAVISSGAVATAMKNRSNNMLIPDEDGRINLTGVWQTNIEDAWAMARDNLERYISYANLNNGWILRRLGQGSAASVKFNRMLQLYEEVDIRTFSIKEGSSVLYSVLIARPKGSQQFETLDQEPGSRYAALATMINRWVDPEA